MDYNKAFLELARFRRSIIGDSAWINSYVSHCVSMGRHEVVVPAGTYNLTSPVVIPADTIRVFTMLGTFNISEQCTCAIEVTEDGVKS